MQRIIAAPIHEAVFKQADRDGDGSEAAEPHGALLCGKEGTTLPQGRLKQHLEGHQVRDLPKSNVPSSEQRPCSNKARFLSACRQHRERIQADHSLLWRLMYL